MNKRLLSLCLALTAMTLGAMAAEELYVGGKKVTLSGSGTVTVSGGDIKSGSVEYDCTSKTLTLNGVTITRSGDNNRGIRSSVSGLTVKFVGTNTITTTTAAGLRFEASTTITGSGTVTVTSKETAFYVYKNTTVTIKGQDRNRLTLNLGGKYGIQGEDGSSSEKVSIQRYVTLEAIGTSNALNYLSDLTVNGDADLTLKGNGSNPTVQSLASLTLGEGVAIDLPLQGKFDSSKKTVVKGSATTGYTRDVTIKSAIAINATNFPDANFRSYVTSSGFDQNSDNHLSNAEIQLVTMINVNSKGISNLKGIGYFTALTDLACSNNSLQSLDVSSNTKLTKLDCSDNSLESLDVSKNTALMELSCGNNSLESLDVSSNTKLTKLDCADNSLQSLDVTKNTSLTELRCGYNSLTTLDVSKNTSLTELYCGYNSLTTLDVSKNTALTGLYCWSNNLESLDVSKNTKLMVISCSGNSLESLDVSKNTKLTSLFCSGNSLESLDVSKNTKLTKLDCADNSLESLDISKNTALTELDCYNNSLKSLDVSKNTALTELSCGNNNLEFLDVSKNTVLTKLSCGNNSLESLDVSKNTVLTKLSCSGNQISGAAMTSLVNSLPPRTTGNYGELFVCSDHLFPDNVITVAQVKIATRKGWKVAKGIVIAGDNKRYYAGLGDVNGDNKIDQTDLDTIVKIIMGQVELGYAGDLNNDGKTDAADIVVMVNILKALGVK